MQTGARVYLELMNDLTGSLLQLADVEEERLAHQAPRLDLSGESAERIARLAYRISQVEGEKSRRVLPPGTVIRPWTSFSARERSEACATVLRILQAMVLLGEAVPPGDLS